jgi:hypothetical protein
MKNLSKNIFYLIILFLFLLIFIFTIGFRLLLNSSVFIANFFSKKTPETLTKINNHYGSIFIDNIKTATNSPSISIDGSFVNFDKIEFYLNDKKVKEINNPSTDTFSETVQDLKIGENTIYLKGINTQENFSKKTQKYTVFYKNEKPKLEIFEPKNEEQTNKNEIKISGETDKEVFVKINGLPITVDALGKFTTTLRLSEGENNIEIIAEDIAGNIETKTIKVIYQKD